MSIIKKLFLKPWLYIFVIAIGIFLKFYHLNGKLFYEDEISTVLYTTGIKDTVLQNNIPRNTILQYGYFDSLLHPSTKPYSLSKEVAGILSETHLTPAHYVFLTFWYRLVGDTDYDYRLFSVIVFIVSLPFVFLLAKTLFHSSLAAWVTVSLYSLSPFIQLQSQEARYHMLWVLFSVLSNYMFLQATKQNKTVWWMGYVVASALNMYTSAISGLFLLGHFIYVLIFKRQLVFRFILFSSLVMLAYSPWLYFMISVRTTLQNGLAWHSLFHSNYFTIDLFFFQLLGFVKAFSFLYKGELYGFGFMGFLSRDLYIALLLDIIVLSFIIYAIIYLFKKSSKELRWFFVLTICPFILLFYLYDVIRNGFASTVWQYQIVDMVGIIFIVANMLTNKIQQAKPFFAALFFSFVALEFASDIKMSANECWVTKPDCESNMQTAQMIAGSSHPLIVTDMNTDLYNFFTVLNEAGNKNAAVMYCNSEVPDIKKKIANERFSVIYFIHASDSLGRQAQIQFGNNAHSLIKDVTFLNPQIWEVKLH